MRSHGRDHWFDPTPPRSPTTPSDIAHHIPSRSGIMSLIPDIGLPLCVARVAVRRYRPMFGERLGRSCNSAGFHTSSDVDVVTSWSQTPRNSWVQRITVPPRGFAFALEFRSHASRSADIPREDGKRHERTGSNHKSEILISPGHSRFRVTTLNDQHLALK